MISCHLKIQQPELSAALVSRGHPLRQDAPELPRVIPVSPPPPLIPTRVYLGVEVFIESVDDHVNFVFNLQEPLKFDDGVLLLVTEAIRPRLPPVLSLEKEFLSSSSSAFASL